MSGRAVPSSRPYAWIVGVVLVLVALVSLQFDRLSTTKISTLASVEYTFSDAIDDSDDDTPRIASGKAIISVVEGIPARHGQPRSSQSGLDKAARPNTPDSRHPRGPPLSV
ncbi:hypothetical protein PY365_14295 [Roseiarcaceae bacterium H3SJ34-1]|uniref:hypothetical protein n=1 Tax=Terripilifer ovatus TaxID=3032367 RepID=UPI003AB99E90|nr:hypothetical protein [Roseiarcaceae bacterium H3SJ34-1]